MSVGAACASRADFGSFVKRSSNVLVVNILAPAGWIIVLDGNCVVAIVEGAVGVKRETFAAESTKAVVSKLVGLEQPETEEI